MENRILSHQQVQYKIRRIAYQIYEAHVEEPEIVLAGIKGGGLEFAKKIKRVLERAYRNWWWYTTDPGNWGGYSHYTTCMLDTDAGNVITYTGDLTTEPDGNNVASLTVDGVPIDLTDAGTFYNVSTVNYLAAGSCNFNNDGDTIWPLDQIIADTQLYVRDSVINYVDAQAGPAPEGQAAERRGDGLGLLHPGVGHLFPGEQPVEPLAEVRVAGR